MRNWHKLHPVPDLSEDRWQICPERFADECEWYQTWAPTLYPATVAYAMRTVDNRNHRAQRPALELSNLVSYIAHALTNMARSTRRNLQQNNFSATITNNGHSLTRKDGWEDIAYLPLICPFLADYLPDARQYCLQARREYKLDMSMNTARV